MSLHTVKLSSFPRIFMQVMFLFLLFEAKAQGPIPEKNVTLISGSTSNVIDTLTAYEVHLLGQQVNGFVFNSISIGTNQFQIVIDAEVNGIPTPIGISNISVESITSNFPPKFSVKVYHLNFVKSIVSAKPDVVTYNGTGDLMILPLANDETTSTGLNLFHIDQTLFGQANKSGDTIIYSNNSFTGYDYIVYTVKDDSGSDAQGIIYVYENDFNITEDREFTFVISNLSTKNIVLPNNEFSLQSGPIHGKVVNNGNYYRYTPNEGFVGLDSLSYVNGDGFVYQYHARVISPTMDGGIVKNDEVYTAKNKAVTFDVFANDLASKYPITYYSPDLVRDTLGIFTYSPVQGYQGVKNFVYKVKYGSTTETGKIAINIGNMEPVTTQVYHFDVLKDRDFLLKYNVPIEGYSFDVSKNPLNGTAQTYSNDTVNLACGSESGVALIRYTPAPGFTGEDDFEVRYCIDGAQCKKIKLNFTVVDHNSPECNCVNSCVWQGDANGDGRVTAADILSLGRFFGKTGPSRDTSSFDIWTGSEADDWAIDQPNGKNLKHADTDGNGIIDAQDMNAIIDNYGKLDNLVPREILGIKDFPFELIPSQSSVDSGDLLVVYIKIGSEEIPVTNLVGLSFGLNINPSLYDSASFHLHFYDNSWFTDFRSNLQLAIQPNHGTINAALTQANIVEEEIDGLKVGGSSGSGIIGEFSFIVEEEIDGLRAKEQIQQIIRNIWLNDAVMEDGSGKKFALPDANCDIAVNLKSKQEVNLEDKLIAYPNPVVDKLILHFNGKNIIHTIKVFDMMGRIVSDFDQIENQHCEISTNCLSTGVYMVQVQSSQGVVTKKIQITK